MRSALQRPTGKQAHDLVRPLAACLRSARQPAHKQLIIQCRRHIAFLPLLEAACASHSARRGSCLYALTASSSASGASQLLVSVDGDNCSNGAAGLTLEKSSVDFTAIVRAARDGGLSAGTVPHLAIHPLLPLPQGMHTAALTAAGDAGGDSAATAAPLVDRVHVNRSAGPAVASAVGESFFVPPRSAFALSDAAVLPRLVSDLGEGRFSLIVLDPPWCATVGHPPFSAVSTAARSDHVCRLGVSSARRKTTCKFWLRPDVRSA